MGTERVLISEMTAAHVVICKLVDNYHCYDNLHSNEIYSVEKIYSSIGYDKVIIDCSHGFSLALKTLLRYLMSTNNHPE